MPFRWLWFKVQGDCCPEWEDYATFDAWATETRDARTLRRRDKSLPFSPENCFWAASYGAGDEFKEKTIALRMALKEEDEQAAREWFASVSHQRRYEWFRLNKHRAVSTTV